MAPLLSEEELALGDPYEVLGVPVEATEKQIRSAYRSLSLRCHPDRFPNDEKAAKQFFSISLAVNLLTDPSKRSFLNGRIEEEKRKKEKTAGMEKKRRTMVEALQAREEEAKRAKLDLARAHADASAEASVQEIGRKMREEAARAAEAARLQAVEEERQRIRAFERATGSAKGGNNKGAVVMPENSLELTLMMQFPLADPTGLTSTTDSLRSALSARYGPLENIDLLPQAGPSEAKPKKSKKAKGPRYAVEFRKTNMDGCWACWKDHLDVEGGTKPRTLVPGTKVKFAGKKDGEAPAWVDSLGSTGKKSATSETIPPTAAPPKISSTFTSSFPSTTASSFPSVPSSFPSVPSSFPTPESKRKQQEEQRERRAADDFESGILFRMRQQEREKLERQIREQEEAEEAAAA